MSEPISLTDDNFSEEVLQSDQPVLVDFWAAWCEPCKALAPTIDALAEELDGQLKVCKLDVDSNMESANKFGVRGIPYIVLLKDGKEVGNVMGNDPSRIQALAEQALN